MKLSTSLLQAITLGVSVTAVAASATSCEKQKIKENKERIDDARSGDPSSNPTNTEPCPACGMG